LNKFTLGGSPTDPFTDCTTEFRTNVTLILVVINDGLQIVDFVGVVCWQAIKLIVGSQDLIDLFSRLLLNICVLVIPRQLVNDPKYVLNLEDVAVAQCIQPDWGNLR